MKIIPNSELKKILKTIGYSKEFPPVFYIGESVLMKSHAKAASEKLLSPEILDSRPFDNLIIITKSTEELLNVFLHTEESIVHLSYNVIDNSFISSLWALNDRLEKSEMTQELYDENIKQIQNVSIIALMPFAVKKTRIIMAEGKSIPFKTGTGNKTKSKKQKYLTLNTNLKVYKKENQTHKVYDSMIATSVCGHWRHYEKKHTIGHDRHGNLITGKTWVSPYVRGEGKVLEEKIRMFIK